MSRRPQQPEQGFLDSQSAALYALFENHLYNHSDPSIGRKQFVENVVKSYMEHLSKQHIVIPPQLRHSVAVELEEQVRIMLLKKTYGFTSVDAFVSRHQDKGTRKK